MADLTKTPKVHETAKNSAAIHVKIFTTFTYHSVLLQGLIMNIVLKIFVIPTERMD